MPAKKKGKTRPRKNANGAIAAFISAFCMVILLAPAVGYFYNDDVKRGIEYLIAAWFLAGVVLAWYFAVGFFTYQLRICCSPILLIPLAFDLLIVWDVYLEASGEPSRLPSF
jgi:hypothetical protein